MYETEVEHGWLSASDLPQGALSSFTACRTITHVTPAQWEEHCTECAWPACYTSCDLYNRRNDGNCRRTFEGFSPVIDAPVLGTHVVRIRFKRWGVLTAQCRLPLISADAAARGERWMGHLSSLAAMAPNLGKAIGHPGLLSRMVRRVKGLYMKFGQKAEAGPPPDYFLLEAYNPSERLVELSLTAAGDNELSKKMPFQRLLKVAPGYNRIEIPYCEIDPFIGKTSRIGLTLNPNILNPTDEGLTLFFGLICFARGTTIKSTKTHKTKKIKVVIWDLDNTIWDGTLVEDGAAKIKLKTGVSELIKELDRRGVINSIASKNDEGLALGQLERFDLRGYFVFPMINWGPKSESVQQIREAINVGEDALAFIDDQAFERAEVKARSPLVRVYSYEQCAKLLDGEEFDVQITQETSGRRAFYQTEELRRKVVTQFSGRYLEFLQDSNIVIEITAPSESNFERIHEIVQRTNQMNFSGTKYSKKDLRKVLSDPARDCFLINADDKYGHYGHVGFCVVSPSLTPTVLDLMFSCRIQSKRVEHAFFIFLMRRYAANGASRFVVRYRGTDRNKPLAAVFGDLGFSVESREGNEFHYVFDLTGTIPENSIIDVQFRDEINGKSSHLDPEILPSRANDAFEQKSGASK